MGYVPQWVWRWIIGALATLVLWVAWASTRTPEALWAPGHLSRYHRHLTQCTQCHEPFRGPTSAKCVACHSLERFQSLAPGSTGRLHVDAIRARQSCLGCHHEHRGELAPLTTRAFHNPHGEFVFRITGTRACTDCHAFPQGMGSPPTLLNNDVVRHLIEEGEGAHRPGRFSNCLACHGGQGGMEPEEDD